MIDLFDELIVTIAISLYSFQKSTKEIKTHKLISKFTIIVKLSNNVTIKITDY